MSKPKKRCKHWDVRLMRYQPLGLGAWTYPSSAWSEVSWDLATHKICFECGSQLAWGPSKDETDEKMGPNDDWGLGYSLAVEQIVAQILAGEFPMTEHHLAGWKDHSMNFDPAQWLMSLTWHVGWLCAAIADDLRADLGPTSTIDDVIRARKGCPTCHTPMGGLCHTQRAGDFHIERIREVVAAQCDDWTAFRARSTPQPTQPTSQVCAWCLHTIPFTPLERIGLPASMAVRICTVRRDPASRNNHLPCSATLRPYGVFVLVPGCPRTGDQKPVAAFRDFGKAREWALANVPQPFVIDEVPEGQVSPAGFVTALAPLPKMVP